MPSPQVLAHAIRALSMDAVQRAKSGHPGAPMGLADVAQVLWNRYLRHNPANPDWPDRDRFVLSNGHASMLLYSLLYLSGYNLTIEDIKSFRQLHSRTPGHPECGLTPGVETTTGPLGQGLANAVGMALAERSLAQRYNKPGFNIVDHYTYVFVGDGCLMEGISHEACSLTGTLRLSKLIVFYDDNGVSIDGHVSGWFTDNTAERFRAYGWHVVDKLDGHNPDAVAAAIEAAQKADRPSLLCCQTVIGWGAEKKAGQASCHGAPLGDEEITAARKKMNWKHKPFFIPQEIRKAWSARQRGKDAEAQWRSMLSAYRQRWPDLAAEFERRAQGDLPESWRLAAEELVQRLAAEKKDMATRKASSIVLNHYRSYLPELLGGSADLAESNSTLWPGARSVVNQRGNYIYFGVREFAMTAISSGLALHGGFIPYAATFLTFSDYARNAVRLAALMRQRVILIYTHDSVGLGEDGPTHQPIEHLASLRLIPNLDVWRPADAAESAVAWQQAVLRLDGPSALNFSRQTLPSMERSPTELKNIKRGAYIMRDCDGTPELIVIATGSEVSLGLSVWQTWCEQGRRVRLVSMPCAEVYARQNEAYCHAVLPPTIDRRLIIEAGSTAWWRQYAGQHGHVFGLNTYGESAPGAQLMAHFGFDAQSILAEADHLFL